MSARHTPGNWYVYSSKGDRVVSIGAGVNGYGDGPAEMVLSPVTGEMSAVDARLICAAPELLEALEHFVAWARTPADKRLAQPEWNLARAELAIAKARGQ